MKQVFFASGKLLLFGEYLVLKGAKTLAIPLKYGQQLEVQKTDNPYILIKSYDSQGGRWFQASFTTELELIQTDDERAAAILKTLLQQIRQQKNSLVFAGLSLRFDLNFDYRFGFGSSSTLLSLLSQWSGADAYELSSLSFNTSGYDIAAASASAPFVYSIKNKIEYTLNLPKTLTDHLLFCYSGKKQSTQKEVHSFLNRVEDLVHEVAVMNEIVAKAVTCEDWREWGYLMNQSEELLAPLLGLPKVKDIYFADYPFPVKSLGAWGGDFVMALCEDILAGKSYFVSKGIHPIYTFDELIKA